MEKLTRESLKGKWVALFGSGGLDSTCIAQWLFLVGVKVFVIIADLGQPEEKDLGDVARRMKLAGAEEVILVDGKEVLAKYMLQVIQGLGHHEGGYMNTTGIARMATVAVALPEILERGIKFVVHGATGRGNDQKRFELALAALAPDLRVYAPWRDPEFNQELGGRKEEIAFCRIHDLYVTATLEKPYSTDSNFCGLTHEAGKLESIDVPPDFVEFLMGVHPSKAPEKGEVVSIRFEAGVPTEINGEEMSLVDVFLSLNQIAGRNGVGIGIDVVENRSLDIKSRGVYESPGATLLERAYSKMLELILDRGRRKFFDIVSRQLADLVYEGKWFYPSAEDLLGVTSNIARHATGTITLTLYRGNVFFVEAHDVVHSLYDPERSSMEKVGDFDHTDSQGWLTIEAVIARTLAHAGQIRKP